MKIPYKCKSKRDLDIIFNKHELFDKGDWLYEEIEHRGNINVFVDTDTIIYSWCGGDCDSCHVNSSCDSVNASYVIPTIFDRNKKLERLCND